MTKYFNSQAIKLAKETVRKAPSGFRYGYIPNLFYEEAYQKLVREFPETSKFKLVDKQSGGGHKRFYVGPVYSSGTDHGCVCHMSSLSKTWKELMNESSSSELMNLLEDTTGIKFNSLCDFGFSYGNAGCVQEPHIDGVIRDNPAVIKSPIACLMYFNQKSDNTGGTCLYAPDKRTVIYQIPILRNGLFFFEQHPDAWHGFPLMPAGAERRIVSLAYSIENKPLELKDSMLHQLTCMKGLKYQMKTKF